LINPDRYAGYPAAIERLKTEGVLKENCRYRPAQYLRAMYWNRIIGR
jgi:hypothetical protein